MYPDFMTRLPVSYRYEQTINEILEEAFTGNMVPELWLATDNYDDAPQKDEKYANVGTKAPISSDWTSPFIGWKVEDVAKWLQEKADTVDLDSNHFAILDKQAAEDNSVVVCKLGDRELQGDSLDYFRDTPRHAAVFLTGQEPYEWEELREGRQRVEIMYGDREL